MFSVWISSQVGFELTSISSKDVTMRLLFQMEEGCDCCVVNGELVKDKQTWNQNGQTYGKQAEKMFCFDLPFY